MYFSTNWPEEIFIWVTGVLLIAMLIGVIVSQGISDHNIPHNIYAGT